MRGLAALEQEGFAISGRFTAPEADEEYCARRLLSRIHLYSRERRRREIEPVTARDFVRFLLRWQHVTPGGKREGRFGVLAVVEQLQGFELAAGAWEQSVLAARVDGYRREWLDELCLSGRSPGDGCRSATRRLSLRLRLSPTSRPMLGRGAAAGCRPAPPRSRSRSATTCRGCCARPAATWPRPNPARPGPARSSGRCDSAARCSGPISPR